VDQKGRIQAAFGKAVRKFRGRAGITQEKLAELAEVHRTYAGDVERGERNISVVNMWKMASGLGVKLSEMVREMERHLGR
jgi:transcriptional regulator with XRE-family HTH domain